MMDIKDKQFTISRVEQVNIFRPSPMKLRGTHKGEEYFVDAGISELPAGTAPVVPTITNDIAWDEALYLKWDPNGFADVYKVVVTAGGSEVATYQGTALFVNFEDAAIGLVNGTEYSLQLTAIRGVTELTVSPVLLTPAPKLVTGLTEVAVTDTTFEFNWTDLPTEYDHYDVYLTNTDTAQLVGVYTVFTNSITLTDLVYVTNYEAYVVAVSELHIYEGPASATISWVSQAETSAPANFVATPEEQVDDTWDVDYSWDSVAVADGYNIYTQQDGGGYTKLNTTLITGLTYTDEDVGFASWDTYVVAVRDGIESPASNTQSFMTQPYRILADASVQSDVPNTTYNDGVLRVTAWFSGVKQYTFIKIDLQGLTYPVTSATLHLELHSVFAPDSDVVRVTSGQEDSWEETTITWNNMPSTFFTIYDTIDYTGKSPGDIVEADITAIVNIVLNEGRSISSIMIRNVTGDGNTYFYSKDQATNTKPYITIVP